MIRAPSIDEVFFQIEILTSSAVQARIGLYIDIIFVQMIPKSHYAFSMSIVGCAHKVIWGDTQAMPQIPE
jgi:hypothetical protein